MFKKYLFCMQYFVEYEINISFYFHNFFFFGFQLWPPSGMNPGSVPVGNTPPSTFSPKAFASDQRVKIIYIYIYI